MKIITVSSQNDVQFMYEKPLQITSDTSNPIPITQKWHYTMPLAMSIDNADGDPTLISLYQCYAPLPLFGSCWGLVLTEDSAPIVGSLITTYCIVKLNLLSYSITGLHPYMVYRCFK